MMTLAVCSILSVVAGAMAQKMLGSGKLSILSMTRCKEEMPWQIDARRYRVNRTHEAISLDLKLDGTIDDTCAVQIKACQKMAGGCKPYMDLRDESLPNFAKKHCEDTARSMLVSAGLDPPQFPIPPGEYHIKDFIMDMEGLPDCVYGEYEIAVYFLKEGVKMGCLAGNVRYEPEDDGFSPFS